MNIAMNMLYAASGVAGGGVYCRGLLTGLAAIDQSNRYRIYTRTGATLPALPSERFVHVQAPVSDASNLWRTAYEYGVLPTRAAFDGATLFHGMGNMSPPPVRGRFVLTVFDVLIRHFPESLPLGPRKFMQGVMPWSARRADRVVVPSLATAREVVASLGVQESRVRVVPLGPGIELRPMQDDPAVETVLRRHGIRRPYVVTVCRWYAHKNLVGLLRAFHALRQRPGREDLQLVLVGEPFSTGSGATKVATELGLERHTVSPGFVSVSDLNALYSAADVFAFSSLYEGFGFPPLEAMAAGTPVVASDAASIPEVVGDAGVLVDARNPGAFADAIDRVLSDEGLRADLRARGLERAKQFSWERCARETLAVYDELR